MRLLIAAIITLALPVSVLALEPPDIVFPVQGEVTYIDDFTQSRGDHQHNATDIIADKHTPVLAAAAGTVVFAPNPEPSYGFMLTISGDDGYTYNYIHLNNDTIGTDDGAGGIKLAYAPGIGVGVHVDQGEHIGWLGDSGNAETISSHLHFEIYNGDIALNPYSYLVAAQEGSAIDTENLSYSVEGELAGASTINDAQDIEAVTIMPKCTSDTLIRTPEISTVYYCGRDGGRYAFQNEGTFFSWYESFDDVQIITTEEMGEIPLRGAVTYRPGVYMVKLITVPKVYAVGHNGTLHWVPTATMAEALYGEDWSMLVRDIPDTFIGGYQYGADVSED